MNNKVYVAVIGLLILICAFLGYKLSQSSSKIDGQATEIQTLDFERERLELDLERMLISYDTLRTENSELTAEMAAQRQEIESLLKKVKDKDWSIHKLKKEASTLREIMKGYVVTIDSLNTLNQDLMAQNEALNQRVNNVEGQNTELKERQATMEEIIATGQMLQTASISTSGVRLRSSGKQVETARASKAEMLKTCFTIRKNEITKPGEKQLYLRIVSPDGSVLVSKNGEQQGEFDSGTENYSVSRTIDYNNQETDVCIFYTVQQELKEGDYKFFIYEGKTLIGQSDMKLK